MRASRGRAIPRGTAYFVLPKPADHTGDREVAVEPQIRLNQRDGGVHDSTSVRVGEAPHELRARLWSGVIIGHEHLRIYAALTLFAFPLHFVWEMLQVPGFAGMAEADHWDATLFYLRATLGDILILGVAYAGAGLAVRDGDWIGR